MEVCRLHPSIRNSVCLLIDMDTHDLSGTWATAKAEGGDVQVPIGAKGHGRWQVQARGEGLQCPGSGQP